MQTGLIFKPEKFRPIGFGEYMRRQALIAARVHEVAHDQELNAEWSELRDTVTNYGPRYHKGQQLQRALRETRNPLTEGFAWQQRKPLGVTNTVTRIKGHVRENY